MRLVQAILAMAGGTMSLSLLLVPVPAEAGRGTAIGEDRPAEVQVFLVEDRGDDDDAKALAIVGTLLGLALLERNEREEREEKTEPEAPSRAAEESEREPEPRDAIKGLVLPEVPARPSWLEARAAEPPPLPDPEEEAAIDEEVAPEAGPDIEAQPAPEEEPSIVIPPPPPMAEDVEHFTGRDVGEVLEEARRTGSLGY